MAVVREWLDYQKKNDPAKYESRFLFPSSTDAPLRDDVLNTRFYRLKRKYEDKLDIGWNLYRLRHTFATNLAEANVPIKTAMRLMGDSTTSVILGVYTHVRNDEARKAGEKINQVYVDMLAETDKPDDGK
jgi:integrase